MKEQAKRFIEKIHSITICVSRDILHISPSKMTSSNRVYEKNIICNVICNTTDIEN